MSLLHSIVFKMIMKSKVLYSSDNKPDYEAARKQEMHQNKLVPIPKNVKLADGKLGNIPVEWVTAAGNKSDRIIFYVHGGGFVLGDPKTRRSITTYLAGKMGYNVVAVRYRLAPEYPFPAAPSDCTEAYRALLKQYDAGKIIFFGESAGGNLVLSTLLQAKDWNMPLPAAVFAIAPTVQYDREFSSYKENLNTDCMVGYLSEEVFDAYLQSRDESIVKNPFAAPYYGDYSDCPPIFLWASTSEVLRDDSIYLYEKLKASGQPCELYLRKNMMHTYHIIPYIPEAKKDLKLMKRLMDDVMEGTMKFGNKRVDL